MPQIIPITDLKNTIEISEQQIREGRTKEARSALKSMKGKCGYK